MSVFDYSFTRLLNSYHAMQDLIRRQQVRESALRAYIKKLEDAAKKAVEADSRDSWSITPALQELDKVLITGFKGDVQ